MDYDASNLPAGYDKARSLNSDALVLWMDTIALCTAGQRLARVLDLGCGTGRFTEPLADFLDVDAIGIDPSRKMLEQAHAKKRQARVRYARGAGEAIPLPRASVDLVFISMVFHHFVDPHQTARECRRVLRTPGRVFLRGGTSDRISSYAYVDFFPASRAILQQRLPTAAFVREAFEAAGFRTLDSGAVTQQLAATHAAYADRLAAGGDSILDELGPHDFAQGLGALREHATLVDPRPVSEPIDYFVFE